MPVNFRLSQNVTGFLFTFFEICVKIILQFNLFEGNMDYFLNPNELCNCFAVPQSITEKLKIANGDQIKALLWAIKNNNFNAADIAENVGISPSFADDAMNFWVGMGVLCKKDQPISTAEKKKAVTKKAVRPETVKPDRTEVARRGLESPEIAFLLQEAQIKCGRALKQNEASTLVWLYDDEGLDVSLILMLLEFAASEGKFSISFIEKTAVEWINDGVRTITDAESKIIELTERKTAWREVCRVFNIERRMPSKNEMNYSYTWIKLWGYGSDILKAAYDACVDAIGKISIPYINRVITNWHKNKIKTVEDLEKLKQTEPTVKENGASYNIENIENNMLSE